MTRRPLEDRTKRSFRPSERATRTIPLPSIRDERHDPIGRIKGAEWQSGVTRNNDRYHVRLNGEPLPTAFAANARKGWAWIYVDPDGRQVNGLGVPLPSEKRRLTGYVEIIPGDRC